MAFQFDPNETPTDGAAAVALLVATLVTAGWAIYAYGTGSGGMRIAGGAGFSSASLVNRAGAWVELTAAGATDTVIFQRNAAGAGDNTTWAVFYAKGGLNADGSGDVIDTEATAGDLQTVFASGVLFPADDALGMCRVSCGADDASAAFYLAGWNRSTGEGRVLVMCDPLVPDDSADTAPLVFYAMSSVPGNPGANGIITSPTYAPWTWYRYGLSGATWCRGTYSTENLWPGAVVPGGVLVGYDGKDKLFVPRFYAVPGPVSYKGTGSLVTWTGRALGTAFTLDPTGAGDDRVVMGSISLPWPAGVAALV